MKSRNFYIMKAENINNAVEPKDITKSIKLEYVRKNLIQYLDTQPVQFYIKEKPNNIYPDFIEKPIPLISDKVKEFFDKLGIKSIFYKPVMLADIKRMKQTLYWLVVPRKIDCMSDETLFNRDDSVRRLKIDSERVGYYKVFKVNGILEDYIIVDESVVNILSVGNFFGFEFEKI